MWDEFQTSYAHLLFFLFFCWTVSAFCSKQMGRRLSIHTGLALMGLGPLPRRTELYVPFQIRIRIESTDIINKRLDSLALRFLSLCRQICFIFHGWDCKNDVFRPRPIHREIMDMDKHWRKGIVCSFILCIFIRKWVCSFFWRWSERGLRENIYLLMAVSWFAPSSTVCVLFFVGWCSYLRADLFGEF